MARIITIIIIIYHKRLQTNKQPRSVSYYERKKSSTSAGSFDEKVDMDISSYPPRLQKKITLVKYFKEHLDSMRERARQQQAVLSFEAASYGISHSELAAEGAAAARLPNSSKSQVYVKRWLQTRHAIIFRHSNKTVQVNFFDDSELVLSSEARVVCYSNLKDGTFKQVLKLDEVIRDQNVEVSKRLAYTKEILYQMIQAN